MWEFIFGVGLKLLGYLFDKFEQDKEMRERFYNFYRAYNLRKNKSVQHRRDVESQLEDLNDDSK